MVLKGSSSARKMGPVCRLFVFLSVYSMLIFKEKKNTDQISFYARKSFPGKNRMIELLIFVYFENVFELLWERD